MLKLVDIGQQADDDIDLAFAALSFSALLQPQNFTGKHQAFLDKLKQDMAPHAHITAPEDRLIVLRNVLCDLHGFTGDTATYDDIQNADLAAVIDRRKGLPVSLAILALHCCKAAGWIAHGINFPGHFLIRLDGDVGRILADPFNRFVIVQAPDLRQILKRALGAQAELSANYFTPVSNREILLRLQNNIKTRQIDAEDYESALTTIKNMQLVAPQDPRLRFDEGVVLALLEQPIAAIAALQNYCDSTISHNDRAEARAIMDALSRTLH